MGSIPQLSILRGSQKEILSDAPLHRHIENNIENWRNKIALIYDDDLNKPTKINYGDLNKITNQLARAIILQCQNNNNNYAAKGNSDGDHIVAVCMKPTDKLVMLLLSIWKAGASYLPLDPTFPAGRIKHILNESQPMLVICDDDFDINNEGFQNSHVLRISNLLKNDNNSVAFVTNSTNLSENEMFNHQQNMKSDPIGIILYTSGSTGVPKGVRISHSTILNRLQWQWETFPYSEEEQIGIFKTALTFVDSVSEIWGPLLSGLTVLIVPKEATKDPERLIDILERYRIMRLVLVPTLLRSILMFVHMNKNKKFLWNLRNWVCSGELLATDLVKNFYDYFEEGLHNLHNFYGSTEVMGDVTYYTCDNRKHLEKFDKVPIGLPIFNTVIYILDGDFKPVKIGEIGEIFVAGSNLAKGYTNGRDPHRFLDNPLAVDSRFSKIYRTGDYGSVQNGVIQYEGRTDSQIKIRGHRVDLIEVEQNILSLEFIDRAISLCYHPGEMDQTLLAFVTLKDGIKLLGTQIESILKEKLTSYMIPQVIIVDALPLLVNGKIDRQTLLKIYENTNNNDDSTIAVDFDFTGVPSELKNTAEDLFETIGSVLGRSVRRTLHLGSNFFELGGNSLNSVFTVTLLREKGYQISISDFISAKDLGDILSKMAQFNEISSNNDFNDDTYMDMNMVATPLVEEDKADVIYVIGYSFYEKADLEQWIKSDITLEHYKDILDEIWEALLEKGLSFIVRDTNRRVLGVTLNFDARDEPPVSINNKLFYVFDFLEYVEGPIRDEVLPKGLNKIFHSFMMGTNSALSAQENIAVMNFMENEVLKLAKKKNFAGIFTTNTNPLTQQLGSDVYKYKTMLKYQVNQYVHPDGTKPFGIAPDDQIVIVHWKEI